MTHVSLVTGASSGIGYHIARELALRGEPVVLVSRDPEGIQAVATELSKEFGVDAWGFGFDLTDQNSRKELVHAIESHDLQIKYLVNNAGFGNYGPLAETDIQKELAMIELNDSALVELCYLAIPHMKKIGYGRILNVASTAAFIPGPLMAVYYATKAFVLSFSAALREELIDETISVTTLCPGPTRSRFQEHANLEESKLFSNESRLPTAESVAEFAVEELMKGSGIVSPGIGNKLTIWVSRFVPRSLAAKMVKQFQAKK